MPTLQAKIYSPRWGHDDTYDFDFERDRLRITFKMKAAVCTYRENRDPEWTGTDLNRILEDDSIAPPLKFTAAMENLWGKWRGGELHPNNLAAELQAAIDWLNACTQAKPKTDFWRQFY